MKAPLCKSAKDSSSLFHEIGNCFLVLSSFQNAKDAARKSLQCAEECGDKNLQLQACVLIGLAEGKRTIILQEVFVFGLLIHMLKVSQLGDYLLFGLASS